MIGDGGSEGSKMQVHRIDIDLLLLWYSQDLCDVYKVYSEAVADGPQAR